MRAATIQQRLYAIYALILLPCLTTLAVGQDGKPAEEWKQRIATLEKRIEEARVKNHIPGLALAVVKDDKIVFAKGFGHSDLSKKTPVETDTLFAVGSTTKAFTSTLLLMLAEEGKLSLDDPVTKHIPEFRMDIETGDEPITLRDLLSHRSGFCRMGILWAGGKTNRPEIIGLAKQAKPFGKFRKTFLYNNVMYMIAGHAGGKSVKSDWETLMRERIFKPLGMKNSTLSLAEVRDNPKLSKGYRWQTDAKKHKLLPMRNLDSIGPAGSINSNVLDMAQWIRFQLAKGKIGDKQLLKSESLEEAWKQQIEMAPGRGYGLGWMLYEWNGKKLAEHGGNTDGFAAEVALLPEENLGFVMLANVTATPLQAAAINIVFESLLGAAPTKEAKATENKVVDTKPYEGVYLANFSQFQGEKFTVLKKGGKLALDIPSQRTFELKYPGKDGKWYFALTNTIAVSFSKGKGDKAYSLTIHQAGVDFECFREGADVPVEVPLEKLQPLLGTYRDEKRKADVQVVIENNRITVIAPQIGHFGLFPPDKDGKWAFRFKRDAGQMRFNKGDDGSIVSITRIAGGQEITMTRVTDSNNKIPSVKEVLAKMKKAIGADKLADFKAARITGEVTFVNQGGSGKVTQLVSGLHQHRTRFDLGKLGYIDTACDIDSAYSDSTFSPYEKYKGTRFRVLQNRHPAWLLRDWKKAYPSVAVSKAGQEDGKQIWVVMFQGGKLPKRQFTVDAKTGLILKEVTGEILPGIGQLPVTTKFSNYQSVGGLMVPFHAEIENGQSGKTLIKLEKIELLDKLDASEFRLKPRQSGE